MKVGFIGAGKMAQALCRGLIKSGKIAPQNIIASSPKDDVHFLNEAKQLGVNTTYDNVDVANNSNVVFIATKPPLVGKIAAEIASSVTNDHLVISMAMGIKIREIESLLSSKRRVIRAMPNTPAVVQSAASAFSLGAACKEGDAETVKDLLSTVGYAVEVPEELMDPITGLSGSGPSYMFTVIEGLADGGVKMGIPRVLAIKLAAYSVLGAAKMVLETDTHPAILKEDVQSPGGSTSYGMHKLEKGGLKGILMDAVEAATNRSKETGDKNATRNFFR